MDIVHTHIHPHTQRFMGVWAEATLTVPGGKGLQVCLRAARKSRGWSRVPKQVRRAGDQVTEGLA